MHQKRSFVFLLLFLFMFSCSETHDSFYVNIDAARQDGAIEKGWIPDIIPESSSEIYEKHNLDTNRVWIRFKFDKKDIRGLVDKVEEVNPAAIYSIEFINPDSVNWWPKSLSKDAFNKKDINANLKIYKYERVIIYSGNRKKVIPSFFVIDSNSNIAYYWQYES